MIFGICIKPVYESKAIYSKWFTRNKVPQVELKLKERRFRFDIIKKDNNQIRGKIF